MGDEEKVLPHNNDEGGGFTHSYLHMIDKDEGGNFIAIVSSLQNPTCRCSTSKPSKRFTKQSYLDQNCSLISGRKKSSNPAGGVHNIRKIATWSVSKATIFEYRSQSCDPAQFS